MSRTIAIAPVRKSILVQASIQKAFEVFTAGIDRWWPKDKGIGQGLVVRSVIEPFRGGRWYTTFEDGSEAVVGHVRVWQPFERFVVSWEINGAWKSESRVEFASEVDVRFIADTADRLRGATGIERVALSGGVFQNVLLLRLARAALEARGLRVLTHRLVPPNDAGLALGQVAVAGWRRHGGTPPIGAR